VPVHRAVLCSSGGWTKDFRVLAQRLYAVTTARLNTSSPPSPWDFGGDHPAAFAHAWRAACINAAALPLPGACLLCAFIFARTCSEHKRRPADLGLRLRIAFVAVSVGG